MSKDNNNKDSIITKPAISQQAIDGLNQFRATAEYIGKTLKPFANYNNYSQVTRQLGEMSKTISNTGKTLGQNLIKVEEVFKPFINASIELTKSFEKNISPLINFVNENRDKLDNFSNSLDELMNHYMTTHNLDEESVSELIESLIDEGKIVLNDDWKFEIIEMPAPITNRRNSKEMVKFILHMSYELLRVVNAVNDAQSYIPTIEEASYIQEAKQIKASHYYNQILQLTNNRYSVINNTAMYADSNNESEIKYELENNDIVIFIITEGEWARVVMDNKEISGWVKSEDIVPIVELNREID